MYILGYGGCAIRKGNNVYKFCKRNGTYQHFSYDFCAKNNIGQFWIPMADWLRIFHQSQRTEGGPSGCGLNNESVNEISIPRKIVEWTSFSVAWNEYLQPLFTSAKLESFTILQPFSMNHHLQEHFCIDTLYWFTCLIEGLLLLRVDFSKTAGKIKRAANPIATMKHSVNNCNHEAFCQEPQWSEAFPRSYSILSMLLLWT